MLASSTTRSLYKFVCFVALVGFWFLTDYSHCYAAKKSQTNKPEITVASKTFTESYLLGEMLAQVAEDVGEVRVVRRLGFGDNATVFTALRHGEIDLYPEYTGTITESHLREAGLDARNLDVLREHLLEHRLIMSEPIGFSNTYALAIPNELGTKLGITKISELTPHRGLSIAFASGFMKQTVGYPGLQRIYGLDFQDIRLMEHALAYEAIGRGKVDLMNVYTTDSKIEKYGLRVLEDDRRYFPEYQAVILASQRLQKEFPKTWKALTSRFEGRFDAATMRSLNAGVDINGKTIEQVAGTYLIENGMKSARSGTAPRNRFWSQTLLFGWQHLYLVAVSLFFAVIIGLTLGTLATMVSWSKQSILSTVGLIQTIPSLALLCFLIPAFGVGAKPAIVALFLYSLLPIVRNTYTGLTEVDVSLLESADVLGLGRWQRLFLIEYPIASRTILAGIKTAAIINIGTATLAALIGAGGFGAPILAGLSTNNQWMIMEGAIPVAIMALLAHVGFEVLERIWVPKGLRV